jgi:hypothetical protein
MTYIISLMLMTAGLVLLTWTFVAAIRLRKDRHEVAATSVAPEFVSSRASAVRREPVTATSGSRPSGEGPWYTLQCSPSRGVRYAPDMGGYTEVPLQLHDASDNRMYVRKRIWVN